MRKGTTPARPIIYPRSSAMRARRSSNVTSVHIDQLARARAMPSAEGVYMSCWESYCFRLCPSFLWLFCSSVIFHVCTLIECESVRIRGCGVMRVVGMKRGIVGNWFERLSLNFLCELGVE